jgi:tryptophan synthase alpha chain
MSTENRLDQAFAQLASEKRKGLLPYVTAGLPDIETTEQILLTLADVGVTAVELGFPYSDPIADGPTIQNSFTRVLDRGYRVAEVFKMVARFRRQSQMPLIGMLSFSIVHRIGLTQFVDHACEAGIDGLILPDLSLEEAPETARILSEAGMKLIMLVSPVTPPDRRQRIAETATGFIYYMSVAGITGERHELPPSLVKNVHDLRETSGKPVVVGFGISSAEQVSLVCQEADGVIIGSALVRRIMEAQDAGMDSKGIVTVVKEAVSDWMTGLPAPQ